MEMDKIKELIQLMKESDLKVLSIEDEDTEIYLEAHAKENAQGPVHISPQTLSQGGVSSTEASNLVDVRAKQIGIFYTQPDEDSTDTFVKVGDKVKVGDQIGLIETMKIFNEVLVEDAGIVEEILVENEEPVEFDQVIMRLRKEEE